MELFWWGFDIPFLTFLWFIIEVVLVLGNPSANQSSVNLEPIIHNFFMLWTVFISTVTVRNTTRRYLVECTFYWFEILDLKYWILDFPPFWTIVSECWEYNKNYSKLFSLIIWFTMIDPVMEQCSRILVAKTFQSVNHAGSPFRDPNVA